MLHFDSETRSLLDLKKVGSAAYAEHPSTEMFSACWFDDQTNEAWIWTPTPLINYKEPELPVVAGVKPKLVEYAKGRAVPSFVQELAKREWSAWNGFGFDKLIMEARGLPCPPKWIDPMRASAVLGLPKSLDAAAFVLFGERKNAVAVSTLKKVCRLLPEGSRKSYSKNSVALTSENLALLTTYCLKDCMLLAGIYKLIQPLFDNPAFDFERLVSELDITMNDMGLLADLDLARLMIRKGQDDIREKCKALAPLLLPYTDLLSKSKKAKLLLEEDKVLAVAKLQGKALQKLVTALGGPELPKTLAGNPKADKNTLAEIVAAGVPKDCEAVIDLRQAATRPFNAKALAAERCVSKGAVLRWMTRYYGAHTGRFSGAGIQPQNFPGAPDDFDPEKALQDLKFGTSEDFGRDCNALARCILKARPGKGFIVVDLSGIELRTAFWLVRDLETLEIVVSKDIYKEVAAKLYQKTVAEVTKQERQVGKIVVLSGIYQAGVPSYQKQMRLRGIKLEDIGLKVEELRDNFRDSYPRLAHKETGIWALCEQALSLVLDPDSEGLFQEAGRLRFRRAKKIGNHPGRLKMPDGSPAPDAVVELPSGNFRFYRNLAKQTFPEAVAWGKEFTRLSGLSSGASELSEEDFTEDEEEELEEEEENLEEWKRRDQSQLSCDRYRSKTSRDMLYGGKVFQGCNQSVARDLLVAAMLKIQAEVSAAGGCCVLSVHDEVVVEVPLDKLESLARRVGEILTTRPAWAPDLPLGSEIFTCSSYRKSAQKGWPCGNAKDGKITKWSGWEAF